jgi:hypothetical protein
VGPGHGGRARTAVTRPWTAPALEALDALGGRLGPRMQRALARLRDRLRLHPDATPGYFDHPMALPVLALPHWIAREGCPEARVRAAAEAAALGYLHVRVHDDLLDEGEADADSLMLANVLLHAHRSALTLAAGGAAGFEAHADAVWFAYAEAMSLEAALRAGALPWGDETTAAAMDRSMPLALPAAALLADPTQRPRLGEAVRHLVTAHQLVNDLVDIERDLAAGTRTAVTERAGVDPAPSRVRAWLFGQGGLDAVVGEALGGFAACGEAAQALGAPALQAHAQARADHARTAQQAAWRAYLVRALGGGAG